MRVMLGFLNYWFFGRCLFQLKGKSSSIFWEISGFKFALYFPYAFNYIPPFAALKMSNYLFLSLIRSKSVLILRHSRKFFPINFFQSTNLSSRDYYLYIYQ